LVKNKNKNNQGKRQNASVFASINRIIQMIINNTVKWTLFALCGTLLPIAAAADTNIAQSGDNPIVFDHSLAIDNKIHLMAAGAERNDGLSVRKAYPKHYYVTNFDDNTNDYFRWTVNAPAQTQYRVWALLNSAAELPLKLSVEGTNYSIETSTSDIGWDRLDMGTITLPSGTSTLELVRNSTAIDNIEIKSLELLRVSDIASYDARVAAFKGDSHWLSDATYGLMFQYGAWGYPQTGDRKSIDDGADDFDVPAFVAMVKGTGARYVIWSFSWYQYWIQAPIQAVDDIMGDSSLTASRDLIGEISQGLQDEGIRFMLYYHQGLQQEPTWAAKQNFPGEFDDTGTGDRTTFFNNWINVVTDVGNRYGTNLDGWFFDDGAAYYPAPFEAMAAAVKAGNPNRLLSYNNVGNVRYTDFQDMTFGESEYGEAIYGSSPDGGDGIFDFGPMEGLLQHSMFKTNNGWGVAFPDDPITTSFSSSFAVDIARAADLRNVPLSYDIKMWEDGTVTQETLDVLHAVRDALDDPDYVPIINDTSESINYVGTWGHSTNRSADDYLRDVHYTTVNGDYFEYSFIGDGITYLAPKSGNYGDVDIYLDDVFQETASSYAASYASQQAIYSVDGLEQTSHTLKVVKASGSYIHVDGLIVTSADEDQSAYVLTTIPGVIEAENYDNGGDNVAYSDTTSGNSGSTYRSDDVDVQTTTDVGGGENVGWIAGGEWIEYTVYDVLEGVYDVNVRVAANGAASGKGIQLTLDGNNLGTVNFSGTGGWQNWTTVSLTDVTISPGSDLVLRLDMIGGGFNLNNVEFVKKDANLALGGTTTQSSTGWGGDSARATDGNTNGVWVNDSVTHTLAETEAYWEVDLGDSSDVDYINVWNRSDSCCSFRLTDFYVFVSDAPFTSTSVSGSLAQSGVTSHFVAGEGGTPTQVQIGQSARYVRIQLSVGTEPLSLAEVEVIGTSNN
jgi:hypothetical protein